ncbi:MAG: GCN5-related N-acetyltransferase [Proteobacteria bacterium]|nr:GCN5-related N-acetyltransferase [Pseudomonadota bacterium]
MIESDAPLSTRLPSVCVAPAEFADWAALLALLRESFAYMEARIDPPSSLQKMGVAELRAKARDESLIIARNDAGLVGCAFAEVKADCVYVGKLAVAERARGCGIARKIMRVAESLAGENGRQFLELRTRVELIENHRAFAALGFEKVAETAHPGYLRPTSITMRKRLAVRAA